MFPRMNLWLVSLNEALSREETIKKRLDVYHNQTSPLKEWYKNDGKHVYINGLGDLDRIFADIVAAIEAKK